MNLESWIYDNTRDSGIVVELGAGFFDKLSHVHDGAAKIGIEIWQPYLDNAKYTGAKKIKGDALQYRKLLEEYEGIAYDTCMIIDFLEHITFEQAQTLLTKLQEDFRKIIIFLPIGEYIQDADVTGHGAHEYQTHRHSWTVEEIEKFGFIGVVDPDFHWPRKAAGLDSAVYFGIWEESK